MTDPTITIGLASLALILTTALQALRAMHYDDKLEKLDEKMSAWLKEKEDELRKELKARPTIEEVVEISAQFSSVKTMQERVEELQSDNSSSIRNSVLVGLAVASAAAVNLLTAETILIQGVTLIAFALWMLNIYYVHQFMGEYNDLERKAKKKEV